MSNDTQGPVAEEGEAGISGRVTRNVATRHGAKTAGSAYSATKSKTSGRPSARPLMHLEDISDEVLAAERNRMSSERSNALGAIARTHNTLVSLSALSSSMPLANVFR